MSIHDDNRKRDKKDAGGGTPVDPAKSEERSWLQHRTAQLVLEKHRDGNGLSNAFWSQCYKQAKQEWSEKERCDGEKTDATFDQREG